MDWCEQAVNAASVWYVKILPGCFAEIRRAGTRGSNHSKTFLMPWTNSDEMRKRKEGNCMSHESRSTLETDRVVAIGIHAENENRWSHYAAAPPKKQSEL